MNVKWVVSKKYNNTHSSEKPTTPNHHSNSNTKVPTLFKEILWTTYHYGITRPFWNGQVNSIERSSIDQTPLCHTNIRFENTNSTRPTIGLVNRKNLCKMKKFLSVTVEFVVYFSKRTSKPNNARSNSLDRIQV